MLLALTPQLLTDINPTPVGFNIAAPPAEMGGPLYFAGAAGDGNYELWKSDGTSGGTVLVSDLNGTNQSSYPHNFFNFNGRLFFAANVAGQGDELWVSSGSAPTTQLLKDINPGPGSSSPRSFLALGNTLYFVANDGTNGEELWKSDGTTGNTVMVANIGTGAAGASIGELMKINGALFFRAAQTGTDYQLWKSDGTAGGTVKLTSVSGANGLFPDHLANANGTLLFAGTTAAAGTELWKSDGTTPGTVQIADIMTGPGSSSPDQLSSLGNNVIFTADDGIHGRELFRGTVSGAVLLKDINPGAAGSSPQGMVAISGSQVYFSANNGTTGAEPWTSDGNDFNTQPLVDAQPGSGSSSPASFTPAFPGLFFTANVANGSGELWAVQIGTHLIKGQIAAGDQGIAYLTDANHLLMFAVNDGVHGFELWKSDGTSGGTSKIVRDPTRTLGSEPANLTVVGNSLFFTVSDGSRGRELWRTDGVSGLSSLVSDIAPGLRTSNPSWLTNLNGSLGFIANDGLVGDELWRSDAAVGGPTAGVRDIRLGPVGSSASDLVNVNGVLYFSADDGGAGSELWRSDGTAFATGPVKDIRSGPFGSFPGSLTNFNSSLFFTANDGTTGTELWTTSGAPGNATLVKDINPSPGAASSFPNRLTVVGNTLFFTADDGTSGLELWKTDGTQGGTALVKNINPGSASSNPNSLVNVNGTLFFVANDGTNGIELWKSDGTQTGTVLVKDLVTGGGSSNTQKLTNVSGTLFFVASTGTGGFQDLWKSDGTPQGTVVVKAAVPGTGPMLFDNLTNIRGTLLFSALDTTAGFELWKSDGTTPGTTRVLDLAAGTLSSSPSNMTSIGRKVFFTADDGLKGRELWSASEINAAPSGADKTLTAFENLPYTFSIADFGFSDPNNVIPDSLDRVKITTLPNVGTLLNNGSVVNLNNVVLASDIQSGKLTYMPPANTTGNALARISFAVQDDGGTDFGGVNLDPTANTATIDVAAINDPPSGADGSISVLDHVPYTFTLAADFGFTDPNDSPANSFLAVKITTLPAAGTLTRNGLSIGPGAFVLRTDTLVFTPVATTFNTQAAYATFTFQVQDDGGTANAGSDLDPTPNTLTINLVGTPTGPVGANNTLAINEDTPLTFSGTMFGFTDPGDTPPDLFTGVKIASLPLAGSLKINGSAAAVGDVVTTVGLNGGQLTFAPEANANGAAYAKFTFQVQDSGNTAGGGSNVDPIARTMAIDVTSVNDPPVGASNTITINEDAPKTFVMADFGFSDSADAPPNNLAMVIATAPPAAAGTLKVGNTSYAPGAQVNVTRAQILSSAMVFIPAANINSINAASPTILFRLQDDGGTANGGQDNSTTPTSITFNINSVNDPPAGQNHTATFLEDHACTFTLADFGFSDDNDSPANNFLTVRIVASPAIGILYSDSSVIGNGAVVSKVTIDAGGFVFVPGPNGNGVAPVYDLFTFKVQDDGGTIVGGQDVDTTARTMSLAVTPVNDRPIGADKTVTINEDVTYTLHYAAGNDDFSFTDPTDRQQPAGVSQTPPNNRLNLIFTSAPSNGTLKNGLSTMATFPATIGVADFAAGSITFTPAANKNSAGGSLFSLTFKVQDDGGTANGPDAFGPDIDKDATTRTLTFVVNPVNDPPVGQSQSFTINEDTPKTFAAADFGFSDPNDAVSGGGPLNAMATVVITSIQAGGLVLNGGVAVSPGTPIPVSSFNANQVVFASNSNVNGTGFGFTFRVQDDGGTQNLGVDFDTDVSDRTMSFTVNSVNDAPQGTDKIVPALEETPYTFGAADFGFNDVNDSPANGFTAVKIATLPAPGSLKLNGSDLSAGNFVTRTALILGQLVYTPPADLNGAIPLTFQVQDSGGTINGGIDLDPIPNTLTINVGPVNDPPSFVVGSDKSASDESGALSFVGWASALIAGPANESLQQLHFVVQTNTNAGLFAAGPSIGSDGKLTFTPTPNASGTAQITIVLKDDGGTASGGQDTSQAQTFAITIVKTHPWHNALNKFDVTGDGHVFPIDALKVINQLNSFPPGAIPQGAAPGPLYFDVTGENNVTTADAFAVINQLNSFGNSEGEAEGEQGTGDGGQETFSEAEVLALLAADVATAKKSKGGQ